MLFIVWEEMIFNFCCVLQISEIKLGVTLALMAELLLKPDCPVLSLLILVVVYVLLLRKRLSLAFICVFQKLRRAFSWHPLHSCVAAVGQMFCRVSVDRPPGLTAGLGKGVVCSPGRHLASCWEDLLCAGHRSEFTRGLIFQVVKHSVQYLNKSRIGYLGE